MTTSDPVAKLQLERINDFYRQYMADKKAPPPDEKSFKEFIAKLPKERKQGFGMTDDLDKLFTSPRDNKKYTIRYNFKLSISGGSEALAWEETGENGKRFVALTMGYVEEYDQERFAEIKKK
jgi:hypothetical protein